MTLWWNDSLVLIMERDDRKILREMDFIARSLISKKHSRSQNYIEKRIDRIGFYPDKNPKEKIVATARYF